MAKSKPPTYTPAPELPSDPELRKRFTEIVAVLAQTQSVSGAARNLELSRNHFQTLLHRTIASMIDAITPKPAGRPAKPEREATLEAENERLRADLETMTMRTEAIERMLKVVGGYASGKTPMPRARSKKTSSEDPEPARTRHEAVKIMREQGAPAKLCAAALAVSLSTIRRSMIIAPALTKATPVPNPTACQRVRSVVRATHGLVGAANLGRMAGLPRRTCAAIKRRELRELELERKARCATVTIAAPGIIRGFDAMHVASTDGKAYWLVAADAAVPYRTSIVTVTDYDAEHVIAALQADFETYGPPLILRLDRIACQRTPDVTRLLESYEVLPLHGPPRHPYYYGQLERQNREHRAWYEQLGVVTLDELTQAGKDMRVALNTLWPRPTLDGWTADEAWRQRKAISVDRRDLITDVRRWRSNLITSGIEELRAQRIAIESALTKRGLLTITQGASC